MVKIFTSRRIAEKEGYKFIGLASLTFDDVCRNLKMNVTDMNYMKDFCGVTYEGEGFVLGKKGKQHVTEALSRSCKVLILLNHRKELGNPVVNICGCSERAISSILKMKDINIMLDKLYLPRIYDKSLEIEIHSIKGFHKTTLGEYFK